MLSISAPAGGRLYLAVSRARIGGTIAGASWGAYVLTLDEIR